MREYRGGIAGGDGEGDCRAVIIIVKRAKNQLQHSPLISTSYILVVICQKIGVKYPLIIHRRLYDVL
jgi:hypothetical protein